MVWLLLPLRKKHRASTHYGLHSIEHSDEDRGMDQREIANLLDARRLQIQEYVVARTMENAFWEERFGPGVRGHIVFDHEHNMASITKAVRYRSPMILTDYVRWLRTTLIDNACSTGMVRETFAYIWDALVAYMPEASHPVLYQPLQAAMHQLTYENAHARQLASLHEHLVEDLTVQVYDSQWHWQMAYGDAGRARARYDIWLMLDYLIDALGTGNNQVVIRHVLWLRERNGQRGLSTTHIQQFLWMLTSLLEQRTPPATASATRQMLSACAAGLLYDNQVYHALLQAQDAVVQEAAHTLSSQGVLPQSEQTAMEIGWYLAYLGDSLGRQDPAPLLGYTRWVQRWFASYGLSPNTLRQTYEVLHSLLERHLPPFAVGPARSMVQAALESV